MKEGCDAGPDSIVPEIFVHDGPAALEFYARAFGAIERSRMMAPGSNKLLHANESAPRTCLQLHPDLVAAEHGAQINEKNRIGWTPLDIAEGTVPGTPNYRPDHSAALLRELLGLKK